MKEKFLKWAEDKANHRHAMHWLFVLSFIESSLSPFPVYFMIFFILSHKVKYSWQRVAAISTISSVLGGVFGYMIGYFLFKIIGLPILHFYNFTDSFYEFGRQLKANQIWVLFIASIIPALPYKIITISSGVFAINFPLFLIISILSRGIKYYFVSYFTYKFGGKMKESITESFWTSLITFLIILAAIIYIVFK